MEIIREAADPKCSNHLVNSIKTIDDILCNSPSFIKRQLKNLFGLKGLEHDEDFASVLKVSCYLTPFTWHLKKLWQTPLEAWQAKCWDPKIGSTAFDEFCETLDKWFPFSGVSAADMELPFGHPKRMVSLGQGFALDIAVVNYGKWIKEVSLPFVLTELVSFVVTAYCFTM